MDGNFFGMHFIWWIFWIVIAIWFIVAIIRKKSERGTPMEILKKRYAKGEISREKYEEIKKSLQED